MIRSLCEVERELIIQAVTETRGDIAQAALKLGIHHSTLYRKLREYGIVKDRSQRPIKFAKSEI